MFNHPILNTTTFEGKRKLKLVIDTGKIILGGNGKLKIYGTLTAVPAKE
jgi:hypothetical protein